MPIKQKGEVYKTSPLLFLEGAAWCCSVPKPLASDSAHRRLPSCNTFDCCFLAADGTWTKERRLARAFPHSEAALETIRLLGEKDLAVYYAFSPKEVTEYDFKIGPLGHSSQHQLQEH